MAYYPKVENPHLKNIPPLESGGFQKPFFFGGSQIPSTLGIDQTPRTRGKGISKQSLKPLIHGKEKAYTEIKNLSSNIKIPRSLKF